MDAAEPSDNFMNGKVRDVRSSLPTESPILIGIKCICSPLNWLTY